MGFVGSSVHIFFVLVNYLKSLNLYRHWLLWNSGCMIVFSGIRKSVTNLLLSLPFSFNFCIFFWLFDQKDEQGVDNVQEKACSEKNKSLCRH